MYYGSKVFHVNIELVFVEMHRCLTFEVTPLSLQHLTVNFEHPLKDSIATGTPLSV